MHTPDTAPTGHTEPAGPRWSLDDASRLLGGLGLLGLAVITGIISYQHGLEVARAHGAHGVVAYLIPLVADLMIATSSLSILEAARNGGGRPLFAWVGLAVGVIVTVVMNVAAGWDGGWGSRLLNAVAPVALILSYEALMEMIRRARRRALGEDEPGHPKATGNQCPHMPAMVADEAALIAFLHARDCEGTRPSLRQHAEAWSINRTKLSEMVKKADGVTDEPVPMPAPEPSMNGSVRP